jgi:hypothetical protein
MRRAIVAAVIVIGIGGLTLGGAVATPSFAATRTTTANAMKTVVYDGYEFQVPASWPVYRLDQHPQTCVRYDVHAVYLGEPGPNMQCTAGLVGRTETVSFIPGGAGAAGTGAGSPGRPAEAGGAQLEQLPAVHGTVTQNAVQHELSVSLGPAAAGAAVLGTYGTDPAVVERVLSSLHAAPAQAVQTVPTQSAQPSPRTLLKTAPKTAPKTKPAPKQPDPVGGFDACTTPSLTTMHVWRGNYAAVGVYIGGANAACAYGNLSASWVQTVIKWGWGILPTYSGPQAPCWTGTGVRMNAGQAAAQGKAAAADAVSRARALGFAAGSPIYYDMEAYVGAASCTSAVLTFLGAWDRQVAAAGYLTGVYSSLDSGIDDMEAAAVKRVAGFTPPDAIWIALWDNKPSLPGGDPFWPLSDQAKQYAGNVTASYGGITLNVDKDAVAGPMAR